MILIITDDQPLGTYSAMADAYGWLASSGTEFTNTFVSIPQCCPARATLMTGLYAHNHKVRDNRQGIELDHDNTLQRFLHDAGYRTGYFGKFLNLWPAEADPPHFDKWALRQQGIYEDAVWNINGRLDEVPVYDTVFLANRAGRFMRQAEANDEQPWMMYLSTAAPHAPNTAQDRYRDSPVEEWSPDPSVFEDDPAIDPTLREDKPPFIRESSASPEDGELARRRQLRTMMSVGDMILELRRQLRKRGEGRDTLVIFTSDNGYMWAQHGRMGKAVPYTPSIQVPLLLRWPGHVTPGGSDGRVVSSVDIATTILAAAGLESSRTRDGRSLLDGSWTREHALTEFWQRGRPGIAVPPWASLRSDTYQYIEYYDVDTGEVTFREYYDLTNDPWQLVNLLGDTDPSNDPSAERLLELTTKLAAARQCSDTSGPRPCP